MQKRPLTPPDQRSQPILVDVIGIVVGFIAADKFPIIAKVVLYVWNGAEDYQKHLAEGSLVVLFVFSFIAVVVGAAFAKQDWTTDRQIMLSMVTALFVATFAIVDQSLPDHEGHARIRFGNSIYFLGWPAVLYLLAPVLLPRVGDDSKMRSAVFLMAVSCITALVCFVSAALLVEVTRGVHRSMDLLGEGAANFRDPLRFWILRPSIVGPIAGASVVVAFAPLWWPDLWSTSRAFAKWAWIIGYSLFSVAYAGLYGKLVFAGRRWVQLLASCDPTFSDWRMSMMFAAYAATVFAAIGFCAFLARDTQLRTQRAIGLPVRRWFWWCVPWLLGTGLLLAAVAVVLPIATHCESASSAQIGFFVIAHFAAGAVLGVSLRPFGLAVRLIPAELRGSGDSTG